MEKTFAIINKDNGKLIGSIGVEKYAKEKKLSEFVTFNGREIGYVLSKEYWGRGLITEDVKVVTDYLFSDLDLDFLLCAYHYSTRNLKESKKSVGLNHIEKFN